MNKHGHAQQSLNLNQLSLPMEEKANPNPKKIGFVWSVNNTFDPCYFADVVRYGKKVRLLTMPSKNQWACFTSTPSNVGLENHGIEPTLEEAKHRLEAWAAGI